MRLFIYTAIEEAPFEGLFEPIGRYDKIILSNNDKQIELFNRLQGSPIKDLLPEDNIPFNDASLFFIPLDMKETFMKLLESLFKKIKWVEDKTTQKPSKDEIGLVGGDDLSQFYDKIETKTVLQQEDEIMSKKQDLEDLFNSITDQDNEIDAIFVCTHDENKTRLAYSSQAKTGNRQVDTDSFTVQIQHFISMLKMTNKVNTEIGSLKTAEFLYSGGIVHITHLPQFGEYTFLVFVSATEEGVEMLALYRKRNLEKILALLGEMFG